MTDSTAERGAVTNELLFETLKAIQAKLSEHSESLREIKGRLGIIESQIASLHVNYASLSNRIDRMDDRIARVETRLGLIDA